MTLNFGKEDTGFRVEAEVDGAKFFGDVPFLRSRLLCTKVKPSSSIIGRFREVVGVVQMIVGMDDCEAEVKEEEEEEEEVEVV